jgi:hypothetical protein
MPPIQKSAILESKSEMPQDGFDNSISKLEIEMPPHIKPPCELGFVRKVEHIQEESDQLSNIKMDDSTRRMLKSAEKGNFSLNISKGSNLKSELDPQDNDTILQSSIDKHYA